MAVAIESLRTSVPTRCRSCGGLCELSTAALPGDVVQVRQPPPAGDLRRFDLVAIAGRRGESPQVKRVWGLPQEQVELNEGEMYLDGTLLQKTLRQLRTVSVPLATWPDDRTSHWVVHTSGGSSPQEQPLEEFSAASAGGPMIGPGQALMWRSMRPARVHPAEVEPAEWLAPSPLVDDYTINQGLSWELQSVTDFFVTIELGQPLHGHLDVELFCAQRPLVWRFSAEMSSPTAPEGANQPPLTRLAMALCDGRLLVESERGNRVIAIEELPDVLPSRAMAEAGLKTSPERPIRIVSSEGFLPAQLHVARDIHHRAASTAPAMPTSPNQRIPESDGLYVLGDNLPLSNDSRGDLGRIPTGRVLGIVTRRARPKLQE